MTTAFVAAPSSFFREYRFLEERNREIEKQITNACLFTKVDTSVGSESVTQMTRHSHQATLTLRTRLLHETYIQYSTIYF